MTVVAEECSNHEVSYSHQGILRETGDSRLSRVSGSRLTNELIYPLESACIVSVGRLYTLRPACTGAESLAGDGLRMADGSLHFLREQGPRFRAKQAFEGNLPKENGQVQARVRKYRPNGKHVSTPGQGEWSENRTPSWILVRVFDKTSSLSFENSNSIFPRVQRQVLSRSSHDSSVELLLLPLAEQTCPLTSVPCRLGCGATMWLKMRPEHETGLCSERFVDCKWRCGQLVKVNLANHRVRVQAKGASPPSSSSDS